MQALAILESSPVARTDADRLKRARLPDAVKIEVDLLERAMIFIASARKVKPACTEIAASLHGRRGCSADSLYRKYYKWLRAGRHWSALVDLAKAPEERTSLDDEFLDFVIGLCQGNKRKCKPAVRTMIREHWRAGKPVPGYGTWQEWFQRTYPTQPVPAICPPDLPRGWTYENIMRYVRKRTAGVDLDLARQGIAAGLAKLPAIPGTRRDLRAGEFVTIDDVKLDFQVHCDGVNRPVDVVGLVALEIGCELGVGFGLRPSLPRPDGSVDRIKLRDMKALIVRYLLTYGYPEYGMTFLLENGTATVGENFAQAVFEQTDGHIKIAHTSMLRGTVYEGGFKDRAIGNSRGKSWVETFFNSVHNEAATLPGQTGRRYDVAPQEAHGRSIELRALVEAQRRLPANLAREFRMPYFNLEQASAAVAEIFARLNSRTDHRIKDFEDVLEWRLTPHEQWRPYAELLAVPPAVREHVLTNKRREQPIERWNRLRAGVRFYQLHATAVPVLLEEQALARFENGEIKFRHEGKDYLFSPYTPANRETLAQLEQREKYLAYFDGAALAADPRDGYTDAAQQCIFLTDGKGRYIGQLWRTHGISRKDRAAGSAAIEQKQRMLNDALARVNRRQPLERELREADIEHNLEVLARDNAIEVAPVNAIEAGPTAAAVNTAIAGAKRQTVKRREISGSQAARELSAKQLKKLSTKSGKSPS